MVNKKQKNDGFHALVALGSNLELPISEITNIPQRLVEISDENQIQIESISYYYNTPAFPAGSGPDYINSAFKITTHLTPENLLNALHKTESLYNRQRPYRWAPRTLDLDLLFYENRILPNNEIWKNWADLPLSEAQEKTPDTLILPHPRLHERSFVLGPLMDIAPEFEHPILKKTIQELWLERPESERLTLKRI